MTNTYCVYCSKRTATEDLRSGKIRVKSKNGVFKRDQKVVRGKCGTCGHKKSTFVPNK